MDLSIPAGLAAIVMLGAAAQWLGWRLRLPAILLLLVCGFCAGPEVFRLVDPDAMFGDLLLPIVSLSVALLLFEGGLTLHLSELGEHGGTVLRLITLGAAVTWVVAGVAAHFLLGFEIALAALVGAVLTVTGPTVVLPLLRQIRPTGGAGRILKWEGILIDPVGAVLAVLVFQAILEGGGLRPALGGAALGILKTIVIGGALGVAGAWLLMQLLKRYWVPDHLHAPASLALAVGAYAVANYFQHEAGLLAVTLLGAVLANQKVVDVRHILEFKENLRVLIISTLFILLAARVSLEDLAVLDWRAFVFLGVIVFVARPAAVFLCTARSPLKTRERVFVASMAPRGVVAAAVSAVFALRLQEEGFVQAQELVPVVFLVIVGTVALYGLGGGPLANRLGLAEAHPQGILIIGAHRFAQALAFALQEAGLRVRLVDTNALNIGRARMQGLKVFHGNVLSEKTDEKLDLAGLGRLFAMTPNDEVNALATLHYLHVFGRGEVYQLAPGKYKAGAAAISRRLRGRILFAEELTYSELDGRIAAGAVIKATKLTDQFGFEQWHVEYGANAAPLLTIEEDGAVTVGTVDQSLDPAPGQTLVALVDEPDAAA